jgi:hypothetical protein
VDDPVRVSLFERFEDTEPIREEWDRFMESIRAEIFLTHAWCGTWWKHYGGGRDLLIFVFRAGGEIVGILPLMRDRIGIHPFSVAVVRTVGTDFSPFATVFPVKGPFIGPVVRALLGELERGSAWEILHIGPVSGMCAQREALREALDAARREGRGATFSADQLQAPGGPW